MIILNNGAENELILNINNNSRTTFDTYVLRFTHALSQSTKSYTIETSDNTVYGSNDRYCEIILNLNNNELPYSGQYSLEIFGNGANLVYTMMCDVINTNPSDTFISYESDNEDNSNFIYIE